MPASGNAQFADAAAPEVLGSDLKVTLADGRVVSYANLDYAATAPCLAAVASAVNDLLPWYASVHRGAGAASRRATASTSRRGRRSRTSSAPGRTTA